ncbi:MAG: polysaccharide deacetylase family protein [Candidatus Saganbacteria bacterium]|nr:polysaccharide deacetylase family protein [Candidatus Saganbacteria bacterium]
MLRKRKRLLILMYHGVGDKSLNIDDNLPLDEFRQQIEYLNQKYKIIAFDQAVEYLKSNNRIFDKPLAVLTFDDAYQSIYDNVYPLLREKKIPVTIFVPVSFVGQPGKWLREEQVDGRIMDWDMINELSRDNMITIGSHAMRHLKLSLLGIEEMRDELLKSKTILEDKLKKKVEYFCYPYGQVAECSALIIGEVKKCGYSAACSTIWGTHSSAQNLFALRRIRVDYHDSFFDFKLKTKGAFDWLEFFHLLKRRS